jgi:hypothetical protein
MRNHTVKQSDTFEVLMYIGSRERYHGLQFSRTQLLEKIKAFQEEYVNSLPVRISEVVYIKGDYEENGYEISGICYPNRMQTVETIKKFMLSLATELLYHFNQNRITVRCIGAEECTIMLEMNDAEATHEIN